MAGEPILGFEWLEKPIRVVPPKPRGSGRVWYKENHRSFGAFIRSDQMRDITEEVAEDIAVIAKFLAPKSKRGGKQDGKRMADQFTVKRNAGLIKVDGNLRVLVEVENQARSAAPNEFGTSKNTPHRMLARAGMLVHINATFKPRGGGSGRGPGAGVEV